MIQRDRNTETYSFPLLFSQGCEMEVILSASIFCFDLSLCLYLCLHETDADLSPFSPFPDHLNGMGNGRIVIYGYDEFRKIPFTFLRCEYDLYLLSQFLYCSSVIRDHPISIFSDSSVTFASGSNWVKWCWTMLEILLDLLRLICDYCVFWKKKIIEDRKKCTWYLPLLVCLVSSLVMSLTYSTSRRNIER